MNLNDNGIFSDELNLGEKMIWTGQPQQGLFFRSSDIFVIPFSLFFCGFAIFWELLAVGLIIKKGPPSFFVLLWGLPFVLVGLYLVFVRFILDNAQRKKTYYAVTDQRILIISGLRSKNIRALDLKNLSDINVNIKKDGKGTITFGVAKYKLWMNSYNLFPELGGSRNSPKFEMIDDAKSVYDQIKHLMRKE